MSEYHQPGYPAPALVGEVVTVDSVYLRNNVGGTTKFEHENLECEITESWWDYETGWCFIARIVDPEAVEKARVVGTSEYNAQHYREKYPDQPHLAESAEEAEKAFDPTRVSVSEFDLKPSPKQAPIV